MMNKLTNKKLIKMEQKKIKNLVLSLIVTAWSIFLVSVSIKIFFAFYGLVLLGLILAWCVS